jgi:hypothetical protein
MKPLLGRYASIVAAPLSNGVALRVDAEWELDTVWRILVKKKFPLG